MTLKFSGEQDTAEEDSAQIDVYRKSEFFRALANMYLFNPILASLSEAVWIVQTSENLVLPHAALTEKESSVRLPDKIAFFNLNFFWWTLYIFLPQGRFPLYPEILHYSTVILQRPRIILGDASGRCTLKK